ncbi:hypothetical protein [Mesorhizobium sp. GR13]|nr:hypothetical protein [Mesorhizobium sp. GR13]
MLPDSLAFMWRMAGAKAMVGSLSQQEMIPFCSFFFSFEESRATCRV